MAKRVLKSKPKNPSLNVVPQGTLDNLVNNITGQISGFRKSKIFYIVIVALGLLLLAIYKKEWIIAATVNGSPISNLELQMRMNQQFRTQTLNQLVNEKIIFDEAAKNNVVVTDTEIDRKISEIEAGVGGAEALNAMLSQQGQNRDSIRQQLKLQVAIEKLYTKDATISAQEVEEFVDQNKEQLKATDSASQQKEAEEILRSQKLSQIFSLKFQELRSKAKIQIF